MFSPHPLNQWAAAQIQYFIRNGQFRAVQAMGLSEQDLEQLKQAATMSVLANARVPWCTVVINRSVFRGQLRHATDYDKEIETVDRMLELGASTEMIGEFFALTHQEVALRRQILELPQRRGRWPVLTEAQDTALWERWNAAVRSQGIDVKNDAAMLPLAMDLARDMSLPLSVIWSAIRNWVAQGLI